MDQLIEFFAENRWVVALANLTAITLILLAAVRFFRLALQFIKDVYSTNLKSALLKIRSIMRLRIDLCAKDGHLFVAYAVHRLVLAGTAFFAILLTYLTEWNGVDSLFSTVARAVLFAVIVLITIRLHYVALEVASRRWDIAVGGNKE